MKKLILLFFIVFCGSILNAQNLVSNPSFEDTVSCPDYEAQINRSVGWLQFCYGTPDYFNSCSPSNLWSVPNNICGNQLAAHDNCSAYAGLYNYVDNFNNPLDSFSYREFIGRVLNNPLVVGQKYFVSFKVSLAEFSNCATNNIGIFFSTFYYPQNILNNYLVKNQSHVYTQNIIIDTLNWVTINGSFIADSSYSYIIIGNFFYLNNTDTIMYRTIPNYLCLSYYYLDDVCVSTDSVFCNNYSCICTVGLENNYNNQNLIISPNPASTIISIKINESFLNNKPVLLIFDILGNIVFQKIMVNDELKLMKNNMLPGIYTVFLKTNFNFYSSKLIIIN